MPSDVIKRVHELAILMNGMQGLSLGEDFEDQADSESEAEGVQGQSTIEGVQAQSTIEGVEDNNDNNIELHGAIENTNTIELHGAIENTIEATDTLGNTNGPEDTLIEHEPQELETEELEDMLMAHEPQEMTLVPQEMPIFYEGAVHEAQIQNTDDVMPENTEILENDMDNRYGPRSNHYNL